MEQCIAHVARRDDRLVHVAPLLKMFGEWGEKGQGSGLSRLSENAAFRISSFRHKK